MNRTWMKVMSGWMVALLVAGCTKSTAPSGVHVGNGMQSYESPYGYTMQFDRRLTLTVDEGAKQVTLDNRQMTSTERSELKIEVIEKSGIKDQKELEAFAAVDSRLEIQDISTPEAKMVEGRQENAQALRVARYLLFSNGTLVKFGLNALAAFQGISLLKPVVESVQLDTTSPKITDVRWEKSELKAGEIARVFIQIEEDLSGVEEASFGLIPIDREGKVLPSSEIPKRTKSALLPTKQKDWYAMDLPISHFIPGGHYIPYLSVADRAGNWGGYGYDPDLFDNTKYNLGLKGRVLVRNLGKVDVTGPQISMVKLPKEMVPGKPFRVLFHATDDVSGVRIGHPDPDRDYQGARLKLVFTGFDPLEEMKNIYSDHSEVRKTNNPNEYELVGKLSHHYVPGERVLESFEIFDNAGNRSAVWCHNTSGRLKCHTRRTPETVVYLEGDNIAPVTMVNDIGEDLKAPKITDIAVSPASIRGGDTFKVTMTFDKPLLDDDAQLSLSLRPYDNGKFPPYREGKDTLYFSTVVKNVAGKVQIVGEFSTHRWLPRGKFGIASVGVVVPYVVAWFEENVRGKSPLPVPVMTVN